MAAHVAEQLVAAAKAALTGLTTTAGRVFDSRVYEVQDADLPCLLVDQGDEGSQPISQGPGRVLERAMELLVVAKVKQNATYRTLCNTIRKEVELALAQNNSLGGLCKRIDPARAQLELAGDGDNPRASLTMTFNVTYYTTLTAPDAAL